MELKPCPFCGGEVYPCYASKTGRHYILHYQRGQAKKCLVQTVELKESIRTLGQAIEAWNRRVKE